MTTRANSQFPWPVFHRLDKQPYGLHWNRLMLQVDNIQTTRVMVAQLLDKDGQPIRDLTWQAERP